MFTVCVCEYICVCLHARVVFEWLVIHLLDEQIDFSALNHIQLVALCSPYACDQHTCESHVVNRVLHASGNLS